MDEQSGQSEEEEVMDKHSYKSKQTEVIGEGIGESEMEELVPEWGWRRDKGADSRDMVKNTERSDQ